MAYTALSFTFGEQPSAAKWNLLPQNDASFNDGTGFADDIIKSKHIDWADTGGGDEGGIWGEELGRTTLGSAGDTITVTSFGARKYLEVRISIIPTGGTATGNVTFNNDTGNNYSIRRSDDGGADGTAVSSANFSFSTVASSGPQYAILNIINITAQEKLVRVVGLLQGAAGAGNAGSRRDGIAKWANTAAQITRLDVANGGTGDFAIGSEVVVLGHN